MIPISPEYDEILSRVDWRELLDEERERLRAMILTAYRSIITHDEALAFMLTTMTLLSAMQKGLERNIDNGAKALFEQVQTYALRLRMDPKDKAKLERMIQLLNAEHRGASQ